ncbi:MAG: hypothetical protein EA357_02440 [Micavibrio sp.]|nr:MAG: hypothetical protein EA357_02440 [Micavibrio sp.]
MVSQYYDWDRFKNIYLEDSFVLDIEESEDQLSFVLEIVLTEGHPLHSPKNENEQHCYKEGKIVFRKLKEIRWIRRNIRPYIDADGSKDYGNIDVFKLSAEGYHLEGDWGEVIINSSEPEVVWA